MSFLTNEQHKRNNTVCIYNDNTKKIGEIQKFVIAPVPFAIIREFEPFDCTLLNQAGHACRPVIKVATVPIEYITGKAVLIKPPDTNSTFCYQATQ